MTSHSDHGSPCTSNGTRPIYNTYCRITFTYISHSKQRCKKYILFIVLSYGFAALLLNIKTFGILKEGREKDISSPLQQLRTKTLQLTSGSGTPRGLFVVITVGVLWKPAPQRPSRVQPGHSSVRAGNMIEDGATKDQNKHKDHKTGERGVGRGAVKEVFERAYTYDYVCCLHVQSQ